MTSALANEDSEYPLFEQFPEGLRLALDKLGYVQIKQEENKEEQDQLIQFINYTLPDFKKANNEYAFKLSDILDLHKLLADSPIVKRNELENLFNDLTIFSGRFVLLIHLLNNNKRPYVIINK